MQRIIVSRHPAAIEFITGSLCTEGIEYTRQGNQLAGFVRADVGHWFGQAGDLVEEIPIIEQATPDDVRGKHVFGNLPLHLAAIADRVTVVEFEGAAPRGQEYTLADMAKAGARLRTYEVKEV